MIRERVRTKGFSVAQLTERRRESRSWQRVAEGERMAMTFTCDEREKTIGTDTIRVILIALESYTNRYPKHQPMSLSFA